MKYSQLPVPVFKYIPVCIYRYRYILHNILICFTELYQLRIVYEWLDHLPGVSLPAAAATAASVQLPAGGGVRV